MRKINAKALILVLVLALLCASLAACSNGGDSGEKKAEKKGSITVFNWYDYIDETVLEEFTNQTGYDVKYVCFTNNEEMYAKLSAGGGSYDVIFPSDYIIERMIKEGGLLKLDKSLIPNFANVIEWMQTPSYDPESEYSVPYMWGTLGILYNTEVVDEEITSWQSMFEQKYKGKVFMMSSYRDTLAVGLRMLGYSINTLDEAELNAAKDLLVQQKKDGIVKGYLLDETKDKMIAGEAAMALMYSGDALYAISEDEEDKLVYVVPEEGSNVWLDGMCIPVSSTNVEGAHAFINFLCDVDVARANMDYIYYSTPIQGVVDGMSEEEKSNLTLNPTQEIVDRCEFFNDVSEHIELYEDLWVQILN